MTDREISCTRIATTQDTGDPVMRYTLGDSKMEFIIDSDAARINVWYVSSTVKGDMKKMLDNVIARFPTNRVMFIGIMSDEDKELANRVYEEAGLDEANFDNLENNRNIKDAVHGFENKVIKTPHGPTEVLVGEWEIDMVDKKD